MVVTHSSNTQEKCQAKNLYKFKKLNATTKKDHTHYLSHMKC
jgi:hypothetical protein